MFRNVFVSFACVVIVAAIVQVSVTSLPSAQTASNPIAEEARTLIKQIDQLGNAGKYVEAIPLQQRILAIREKTLGPDHPDLADSLNSLAILYHKSSRYAEAEPLYKRSLAIWEKTRGPDHFDVAGALNNLALLNRDQGRYADAEQLYRRSLSIGEKALGLDHLDVAASLSNLAELYRVQGRHADVEPLHIRSLAIREKVLGPDHTDVAASLTNLATLYKNVGRYAEAEPLFRRSLAIDEKALGPDHPDVAVTLTNLANLYLGQSRYADAEQLYRRSLAISEKMLGSAHPIVAGSLGNLGNLYQVQGRHADAEPLLERSLAVREKALGPDHRDVAQSLNMLALVVELQGRTIDALPLARRAVAAGRAWPSVVLPVLLNAQHENLISAEAALNDSLDVAQRVNQTSAAAAVGKLAVRLAAGNDRLAQLVRREQDLTGEAESLDRMIIAAVSREPARRDAVAEQQTRDRLSAVAAERAALQMTFAAEFPDYAALSNPRPLTAKHVQPLLSADEALVVFAAADDRASYVFALTRDRFDWASIPLGGDALSNMIAAFRRGLDVNQPGSFDLGRANELYVSLFGPVEALVEDKKQLLVVPSGALSALPFHLLVTEKPAVALPNNPDGYRDAAWLFKRQAVTMLPSVASLKALRAFGQRGRAGKPLVGFGDPVFNPGAVPSAGPRVAAKKAARNLTTRAYTDFWQGAAIDRAMLTQSLPALPDTGVELKSIAQNVGASAGDIYLSRDANETTVKRASLADYRIVYFATHALVAGDVKGVAEPSLVLSIPVKPTELDDGLLTASEVAQLKLNADWVVLSACNTIAGDKPGAEALSGLARSFFYAGARALLVSHWAVESEAATRLTTSTFEILKLNPRLGRAEALRQAMLGYLKDRSSPEKAYPAFWGPFALIGEGGAR